MKKKEPTREKLLHAMEEALKEKPYDAITVGELAGWCGISRQGFYRHFPHKEALCAALSRRYVYSGLTPGSAFTWDELIGHFLQEQVRHRAFYMATARAENRRMLYRIFFSSTWPLYENMIAYRQGAPMREDQWFLLQSYCRGGIDLLTQWVLGGMKRPALQLRDLFARAMPPEIERLLRGEKFPKSVIPPFRDTLPVGEDPGFLPEGAHIEEEHF